MPGHRQLEQMEEEGVIQSPVAAKKRKRGLAGTTAISVMATVLLTKWSWGALSSVDLQELAAACQMSGNKEVEIDDIASIGGYGENVQHMHRDLMNRFFTPLCTPKAIKIEAPCLDNKGDKVNVDFTDVSVILPSMWLTTLLKTQRHQFD